jgi:Ferredoxin-like domain in Api92-like protein
MPNWVYNGLTAQGPKESVQKMKEQLNTPFVDYIEATGDLAFGIKQRKYSNPVFSFRNIIAPTDLEAYKAQPVRSDKDISDPDWWSDLQEKSKTDNSWYNWNIRNWGTKWDVAVSNDDEGSNTYMEEYQDEWTASVYYNFDTAWSIPEQALITLSSQYPDLLFTLSYQEETGWGGEMEILRGVIISHEQYESKCNDCEAYDTLEYCEDCENEVCSACGFGNEEAEANQCQTHMVESKTQQKENA